MKTVLFAGIALLSLCLPAALQATDQNRPVHGELVFSSKYRAGWQLCQGIRADLDGWRQIQTGWRLS